MKVPVLFLQGFPIPLAALLAVPIAGMGCRPDDDPTNTSPTVSISSPQEGSTWSEGEVLLAGKALDAEDTDPSMLQVRWTVSGLPDPACPTSPAADGSVSCTVSLSAGSYTATLIATDSGALTGQAAVQFTVAGSASNTPPVATITNGETQIDQGASLTLTGSVADAEDAPDRLQAVWTSNLNGNLGSSVPSAAGNVSLTVSTLQAGLHQLCLEVYDTGGLKGSDCFSLTVVACLDQDQDGSDVCGGPGVAPDCNDNDSSVYPGAVEQCDGKDNDCDDIIDEGFDQDDDGFLRCEVNGVPADCDDLNDAINPDSPESCNGIDDNCNGVADEEIDEDLDGQSACEGDCNDGDDTVFTGAAEVCDAIDNNCDDTIDEGFDTDDDGFSSCDAGSDPVDCNDANPSVFPGAPETCNGLDDNCNGSTDDGFDLDGDGFSTCTGNNNPLDCDDSNPSVYPGALETCNEVDDDCDGSVDDGQDSDSDGYAFCDGDCDDTNGSVYPGATEQCNALDDDCDGSTDEGFDQDGDGFYSCSGGVNPADCDDSNAQINPDATESCNALDDDCDGRIDDGFDQDGDGFSVCGDATHAPDCNDNNNTAFPGALEQCDGLDNDCDGALDEGFDQDSDGFTQCGSSSSARDCDDSNPSINPGAAEVCDGIDNNCNSAIDEGFDQDGDGFTTCQNDCDDTRPTTNPGAQESCNAVDDDCDGSVDENVDLDQDGDGYTACTGDCDDQNASVNPGATETCDSLDNDCDGSIDDGFSLTTYYRDVDGDGYGNSSLTLQACSLPAGYSAASGDCNDGNAAVNPGTTEACDTIDNNCNGQVDEGFTFETYYRDVDGDGYGNSTSTLVDCARPSGYVLQGGDCNDSNAAVNPGATEVCDAVDNDCDGGVDEGVTVTYYRDADGDGYGTNSSTLQSCSRPGGYATVGGDCNDANASANPGATEACDTIDNDCDGLTDEGVITVYYRDSDGDGYGLTNTTLQACTRPVGYAAVGGDCNDGNATVYPTATEICDSLDNDCDGTADEGLSSTWYLDADGDGFGTNASTTVSCSRPIGYVGQGGDCNDANSAINPGASEVCDNIDNDCDGSTDEGLPTATYYLDQDRDGYGSNASTTVSCVQPAGYAALGGDCNDANPAIHPAATEVCDAIDNDCDNSVDEGLSTTTYYRDQDGDGFGTTANSTVSCTRPSGYATVGGDCDDANAATYPGAPESCDSLDNDCDGVVDDGVTTATYYRDQDADGYGVTSTATIACVKPAGYVLTAGDCNDANAAINPGATEVCDAVDNDCDGSTDEGVITTYYQDQDGDGFGVTASTTEACTKPSGYATAGGDCNDTNAAVNPSATEVCDSIDNDCDGAKDEGLPTATYYQDSDGDGYGTNASATVACSKPSGSVTAGGDCNDSNTAINPGAIEVCDSIDNDCDGAKDEGLPTATYYQDSDGDGYGTNASATVACSKPSGYVTAGGDCNDNNTAINPGSAETCDSLDNDCDGAVDEGLSTATYYRDADSDGYGTSTSTLVACTRPAGYASIGGDCNDSSAAINPGATEICDSVDNDCDGSVDEGVLTTWYRDADGDGYGTPSTSLQACTKPSGYVSASGDCNDNSASINPAASELCDGIDNDCDGSTDEGLSTTTYYRDADADGYGTNSSTTTACSKPTGYSAVGGDCDDTRASVNPAASEVCDGVDNNCNSTIDEGLPTSTYYRDGDNDGYGTSSSTTVACSKPSGYSSLSGDCNDANAAVNPGATESCDGFDNDCDGAVDEGLRQTYYADSDGDTYGSLTVSTQACSKPTGYVTNSTDCNDNDATVYPSAPEGVGDANGNGVVDGDLKDNDCDGTVDEGTDLYDDDKDGYTEVEGDCNDAMASINPGAVEGVDQNGDGLPDPDGIDNNCNGQVDEGTVAFDDDGDGYTELAGDCNDSDPNTFPSAGERFDGKDNNCDGRIETEILLGNAFSHTGSQSGSQAGFSLDGAGDVNGDGTSDLVVGSPGFNGGKGAGHLVFGHKDAWTDDVSLSSSGAVTFAEETSLAAAGFAVSTAGDLNGDLLADFAIGAPLYDAGSVPDAGEAYIVFGRSGGWVNESLDSVADTSVGGLDNQVYVGQSLGGGGDVNGDGFDDLLIGGPWPASDNGWLMVVSGKASGWLPFVSMFDICKIEGKATLVSGYKEQAGFSAAITRHTDSDIYDDILVGGLYNTSNVGDAWFIAGRSGFKDGATYLDNSLPDIRYYGTTTNEMVASSVADGDVNNDGFDDFLIGRKGDGNGTNAKAYLYYGGTSVPSTGSLQSNAHTKFTGATNDKCPCSVSGVGDIDNDGYDDIAIGVANNQDKSKGGRVYLFYGKSSRFSSSVALSTANMSFYGEAAADQAGFAVAPGGDVNADGVPDFLIGAPYNDTSGTDAGKIYVLHGFRR